MTIQFINSWNRMGMPSLQEMNPNYVSPLEQIQMRYQEIEYLRNLPPEEDEEPEINEPSQFDGIGSDKKYTVAVVDFCDDNSADIDLDGDGKADMAHGNVVANLISSAFENSDIFTFDISETKKYTTNERMVASLQYIVEEIKSGECDYDALNLSLSSRMTYADLSKALGVTINNDNVSQYADKIKSWLHSTGAKNGYSTTSQVVKLLEEIEKLGTDVYIAAANVNDGSDDELNLYSLVSGSTTVGAKNKTGGVADFSFQNSLIDTWALGEIEVKKIKDGSGNLLGFDLNHDGEVDIDSKYSSGGTNSANAYLKGTSFATPYMIMQQLS
ncbi:hypothetical protein J6Q66_02165 [bacterium]|nr:hypothetical protein [bacterium]